MEEKDIISMTLSGMALAVSLTTFSLNYLASLRNSILARKPVLIFEYQDESGWTIRNVGGGPALNVLVAQKRKNGEWFNPVRVPPLSKDGRMVLKWLGHVNSTGLGATYADTENLPYTSTCGNDLSKVSSGLQFGPWQEKEIGRHWNQPLYRE
jgi:hypothetical protein